MSAPRLMVAEHGQPHAETDRCPLEPPCRPLVVIDPEDREQIARLYKTYATTAQVDRCAALADALRSLVTEPKPEEPQGLGAVVEDAEGRWWIRTTSDAGVGEPDSPFAVWARDGALTGTARRSYDRIAVVRVISEGAPR